LAAPAAFRVRMLAVALSVILSPDMSEHKSAPALA